jgi:hypothetical protein
MLKQKAIYRSVWDGNLAIETDCLVNMESGLIEEIEYPDVDDLELNSLDYEEIQFADGRCLEVFYDENEYFVKLNN